MSYDQRIYRPDEMIPVVINETYTGTRRPYVLCHTVVIPYPIMRHQLITMYVDYIYDKINDHIGLKNLSTEKQIHDFKLQFCEESPIDNPMWEAKALIDNEWTQVVISDKELLDYLLFEYGSSSLQSSRNDIETDQQFALPDSKEGWDDVDWGENDKSLPVVSLVDSFRELYNSELRYSDDDSQ